MSKYDLPISYEEIKEFKDNLNIGQAVRVLRSDAMWDKTKRKKKATIIEKHRFHVVCQHIDSGICESFTYVQMILGEGIWLV